MSISPARAASFDILLRIEHGRAFSSVLLPIYAERLSPADRGLCHETVLGALREQIKLDRILDVLAPGRKLDIEVRIAIRLGLYQLLFLTKVPARAAINESVELVKRAKKSSASGFVNAILRRASREPIEVNYSDDLDRISVETSHPRWLIERWAARLGTAGAEGLSASNNQPAKIAFRVIGEADLEVEELLACATPSKSVDGCFLLDRSPPLLRKLADESRIYLQDEASQMVAHGAEVPNGGFFLDVCAAPGGKTGLVGTLDHPRLAVAGDLYQPRVELLRENTRRQGIDVRVVRYNAEMSLPFAESAFDAVLVDAPCSGTGTIRHNPEIRYFLDPNDIEELSLKQRRIVAEASKAVKKGGLLMYSTCSLEPDEGEQIAEWFLKEHSAFGSIRPRIADKFVTDDGFARTWPYRDGMDGFFIAAFRKA
ncbi:MAG TPA: 16S rRNA (cytosine(967)-C(5))-methyltransferase RsmB [Pyrinomonadaceae bacterium]|jgi:16S rRNA (cytosine967-C5)-methyltransferase